MNGNEANGNPAKQPSLVEMSRDAGKAATAEKMREAVQKLLKSSGVELKDAPKIERARDTQQKGSNDNDQKQRAIHLDKPPPQRGHGR